MKNIVIVSCDFNNKKHCEALTTLMNEYIMDKMGGGESHTDAEKELLIQGLKNHPSKLVYLAFADDRFIGLVNCFVNFATFTVKPFINIHDVIVTREWRNKGVGRKILQYVLKVADETGCSKVTLEVREDNVNARALYNSLGFHDAEPKQYYWSKYL
jgi:ribosomal protein S18 acetylase RimI-like enzyme